MNNIGLKVAEKLASIARKPNLSSRTMFILMQRCIRHSLTHRKAIQTERRIFRREAGKLKPYLPFAQSQMDMLLEKSRTHRADEMSAIKQGLIGFGYHIVMDTDGAYAAIGFEGVCDLLSINPVHRKHVIQQDRGLAGLIYVERLENSASPKPEAWGEGGPLFEACFLAMMEWIKTAPEEELPDLFGHGSPFDGVVMVGTKVETLQ